MEPGFSGGKPDVTEKTIWPRLGDDLDYSEEEVGERNGNPTTASSGIKKKKRTA